MESQRQVPSHERHDSSADTMYKAKLLAALHVHAGIYHTLGACWDIPHSGCLFMALCSLNTTLMRYMRLTDPRCT